MRTKLFWGLIILFIGLFLVVFGFLYSKNNYVKEEDIFVFKEHEINVSISDRRVLLLHNEEDNNNVVYSSTDESVVKVDQSGIITAVGEGLALITATSKNSEENATCIIVVSKEMIGTSIKEVNKLTLNMSSIDLNVGTSSNLIAIIDPIDATNKELSWSTSNKNIANVDQSGKVTAIASGTVDIIVTSKSGKTATCKVNVKSRVVTSESDKEKIVNVSTIELNKNNLTLELAKTYSLIATITPTNATDKSIIWSSTNSDVAIVSDKGIVTALKEGNATIIATSKDGGKTAKCDITVKYIPISVTSFSLNKSSLTLNINETATLIGTVNPSNADNKSVVWSSSNTSIATVDNKGLVTGIKEGTTTIVVTTKDGEKTAKCNITVKYVPNVVTGVSLNTNNLALNLNETSTLKATISPSNADNKSVTWSSDNPSVVSVSSNGLIKVLKTGVATITVTTNDGEKTAKCIVKAGTRLIFIGDSRVHRLAGNGGSYSINYRGRDKTFIEKGGTAYSDWFSSGSSLMSKVDANVSKLNGVRCAIIIGLAGNDLNHISASSISIGRQKIVDLTIKYNASLVTLAKKYNNLCTIYFTSVNPVQLNKSVTVYSYDSTNALTKEGRSNSKIETFNNSLKNLILQDNVSNLKYIDTSSYFVEYKDKLKNGYNTSDGTHYNEKTTQLVYDKILELTGL